MAADNRLVTAEAIGLLRNLLQSPTLQHATRTCSRQRHSLRNFCPRYETRATYSTWKAKPRQKARQKTLYHRTFNKDIILLLSPTDDIVVKQRKKEQLYKRGHILNAVEFDKTWDHGAVLRQIRDAFKEKIPDDVSCELLMACGNKLIAPVLRDGQQLDANMIQKVLKFKALYVRPSRPLEPENSDESCCEEEDVEMVPSVTTRASRRNPVRDQPDQPTMSATSSLTPVSSAPHSLVPTSTAASSLDLDTPISTTDYGAYLSVINLSSDDEEEEDLYAALSASMEDQIKESSSASVPIEGILLKLAEKINNKQVNRFNINRAAVLDGAIRGFKRISFDPTHRICVRFSDDKGTTEEAVDLGGPRREFLRLLTEALAQSEMFEGTEGNLNLALDASAVREDRYFITGKAIAVSLVHGGPSPNFLSKTLFDCLVQGPEKSRPGLGDIADPEIRAKIQKVSESTTLEELTQSTEPLLDYLANAGCLKLMKTVDDRDRLVEDVLMFQVINRVRGPFERFRDGLKTLGVLEQIQKHPESFLPVMCYIPKPLTADQLDRLFHIRWSEEGSNKKRVEETVVAFWRDYLQDIEEEDGSKKLGDILAFATGSDAVPPIGFSPQPSLEFLHPSGGAEKFPVANTCISCLRLPIYSTYSGFKSNMDFAIRNTQGFGMA
ncbi:G2/M phase-specific E3 ubiquitin-protein ligase [Odontesthes bonariensis]|uniref:G2/M phase-specific E3 ubiquitin-protein ligase n=1 Tax=Odontesthes bonariensis TaxID=219752 RepID=UPI003F580C53